MHQMSASTFGMGTPFAAGNPGSIWGLSPQTTQGFGVQSYPQSYQQTPWNLPQGAYGAQPIGVFGIQNQPLLQLQQLLHAIPQQLQQIQQLQQQQLIYLQQLLQFVPGQLQQLQQLVQTIPQHFQQQWQPFTQATQGSLGFGLTPQVYGGQVM